MKNIIKKIPYSIKLKRMLFAKLSDISINKNVVMLHTGRCGSQVVGNMLNERKDVFWAGEIFEKYMVQKKLVNDFYSEILNERRKKIVPNFGFEIKRLDQLHMNQDCLNMKPSDLISELKDFKNIKFILLERKNYLRRAISAQVGRDKKSWHSKNKSSILTKTYINIKKFQTGHKKQPLLELFESMENNYKLFKDILPSESLFITYEEDILEDPRKAYKKICDYLDLSYDNIEPKLKRTNPYEIRQMISNYDEVKNLLDDTKYEWMLFN